MSGVGICVFTICMPLCCFLYPLSTTFTSDILVFFPPAYATKPFGCVYVRVFSFPLFKLLIPSLRGGSWAASSHRRHEGKLLRGGGGSGGPLGERHRFSSADKWQNLRLWVGVIVSPVRVSAQSGVISQLWHAVRELKRCSLVLGFDGSLVHGVVW